MSRWRGLGVAALAALSFVDGERVAAARRLDEGGGRLSVGAKEGVAGGDQRGRLVRTP